MVISFIGFFAALILLIIFTMRGVNIIIAALVSSAILALTSGLPLEKALTVNYMDGFTGYFASWFLVYLLGAVFGKVMEETKAADAIAEWIKIKVGANRAVFACCNSLCFDDLWWSKYCHRRIFGISNCSLFI